MKKRIFAFAFAVLSFFGGFFKAYANAAPEISAKSGIIINSDTDEIIFEKNSKIKMGMASTTKIMAAVIVIENADLNKTVTVDDRAVGIEGTSIYIKRGERISVIDLLYALMLQSANDAAVALAYATSGNIDAFVDKMNEKAKELGLFDTHFKNPHGLSDSEHYTTAYDLAKITQYAMQNELFRKIVATKSYTSKISGGENVRTFVNHNRLLRNCEDITGVKTGYTKATGRCLVTSSESDGLKFIAVTLSAPDDWKDHRNLHDFAKGLYEKHFVAEKNALVYDLSVVGGENNVAKCTNAEKIEFYTRKNENITIKAHLPRFVYAPYESGEKVGEIRYYNGEKLIFKSDLVLTEKIAQREYKLTLWQKILKLFGLL